MTYVRNLYTLFGHRLLGLFMLNKDDLVKELIFKRIKCEEASTVWTPRDFLDLGSRNAVDKVLQRMVTSKILRRIDRGLYDQPRINKLTKQMFSPDYRKIIEAVARRDQVRLLIDGMTAANELGLTNAVPAKVVIHTDGRLRSIKIEKLIIQFKLTSPNKLYWADRPAMRLVQSLYWLQESIKKGTLEDEDIIQNKIIRILREPNKGTLILEDLKLGLHTLPSWMQDWVRNLLST